MGDEQKDIQALKLQELESELEKLGQELTEFKSKHNKENAELNNRLKEVEDKYTNLEIVLAEIKKDISHSATEIKDIKDLSNTQLKEQRDFFNKSFKYLLITICVIVFVLLGVKVADVAKFFM